MLRGGDDAILLREGRKEIGMRGLGSRTENVLIEISLAILSLTV
jgi:hypothetical protein